MSGHRTTVDQRELVLRRHLNSIGDVPELTPAEDVDGVTVEAAIRVAESALASIPKRARASACWDWKLATC